MYSENVHYNWFSEYSPDGKYYIGAVCSNGFNWLGGDTDVDFNVYEETPQKRRLCRFSASVYTSNEAPDSNNYKIEWNNGYAILYTFDDPNGPKEVRNEIFRFYWEDYE